MASAQSGRRWPLGLVGMLAMVVGVERWVVRHDLDFTTVWAADWSQAARGASRSAPGCTLLCFGDSQVKYGVSPTALQASMGGRAHNLAVQASKAPAAYFLLRRALEAGARPATIVVDYDGHHLGLGPEAVSRQWPELASWRDQVELARVAGSASLLADYAVSRLLPSAKSRFEARENLYAALAGRPHPRRDAIPPLWRNWRQNRGAQPMPPSPPTPLDVRLADVPWEPAYVNKVFLDKFMKLAASRGIPVYWLVPPVRPEVQRARDGVSSEPAFTEFLRRAVDRYPNLTALDARHSGYPASAFHDITHLDRRGAAVMTRDLAAMIRAPGSGGARYRVMPAFAGFDGEGPEDILQSQLVLEARSIAVR